MTPQEIQQKRERRIATAPALYRNILSRVLNGQKSKVLAIKAMCLECNGFEREAIAECTAVACPLWHFRPFQTNKTRKTVKFTVENAPKTLFGKPYTPKNSSNA